MTDSVCGPMISTLMQTVARMLYVSTRAGVRLLTGKFLLPWGTGKARRRQGAAPARQLKAGKGQRSWISQGAGRRWRGPGQLRPRSAERDPVSSVHLALVHQLVGALDRGLIGIAALHERG